MVMNGTVAGGAFETPIGGRCLLFEVKLPRRPLALRVS
jgi:hypothetical protein